MHIFCSILHKYSAARYSTVRIVVSQYLLPAVPLGSHGVGAVLAHANAVSEAFGGDDDLVSLTAHIEGGRAQVKGCAELVSRDGAVSHRDLQHSPRAGDCEHLQPVLCIITQADALKGCLQSSFQLLCREPLVLAEFRRRQVGAAVHLHKVVHRGAPRRSRRFR